MLPLFLALALQDPLTIDEIMARVAENQTRAEDARTQWVYAQDVMARMHRSNGKLAREESSQYVVTPTATGIKRERQHFEGKYENKGKLISYDHDHYEYKGVDIDGDLISDMVEDFTSDKSKDGIRNSLFPLTAKQQKHYVYKLERREDYRGTSVYRVSFAPKHGEEDADWKGEVLIDAAEFQPLVVTTSLAWNMPGAVKVFLGTDIRNVGFKVTYKKVADGVWFPATYGGEFSVKGLFLYKRTISLSVRNDDFKKADVASKVTFETPKAPQ